MKDYHKNNIIKAILIVFSNILFFNTHAFAHNLKMTLSKDSVIFSLNHANLNHGKVKAFDFPAYTMLEPALDKAIFAQKNGEKLSIELNFDLRPFAHCLKNKNKIIQLRTDFYVKGGDSIYIELFNPEENQYNRFITYGILPNYTYQPTIL